MEIKKADVLGFCFGVRRAVDLAEKALWENAEKKVYSLGPLIHNEIALKNLEEKGLRIVETEDISSLEENSVVIIRAHGISPIVTKELEEKKVSIVDATCPRVKASQKMVERYTKDDDFVILTGDKNHGEVKGIAGYADKNFLLLQNHEDDEIKNLPVNDSKNYILLSQTTYSQSEFEKVENLLKSRIKNLTVMNTICPATQERQEALKELCKKVDGVLIIGGKNSANTIRLFQTAQKSCEYAAHIQDAGEIPEIFYQLKTVGISAGASTPDVIIENVCKILEG